MHVRGLMAVVYRILSAAVSSVTGICSPRLCRIVTIAAVHPARILPALIVACDSAVFFRKCII